MKKLMNIFELSEAMEISVRTLRYFVASRKIPFLKIGHRTLLFEPAKVEAALQRYEIPTVSSKL